MTKLYNLSAQTPLRKNLRNNATKVEIMVWNKLKGRQFLGLKFRRQYGIGKYIVDFCCPELKLVLEIDGWIHGEGDMPEKDFIREKFIREKGFRVKRYYAKDIFNNIEGCLIDLEEYCKGLTTPGPSL